MTANGHRPSVLVSDGGRGQARSTLATVRALALGGYAPVVTTSGPHSVAAASRYCTRSIDVPRVNDPGFAAAIARELAEGSYLTFLAASDAALLAMGAQVAHIVDKNELAAVAGRAGLTPAPGTAFDSLDHLRRRARDLDFPVVVKPAHPGQTVRRIQKPEDLALMPRSSGPLIVQPYITEELSAVGGVIYEGRVVAAVHQRYLRTWPPDCGGACAAETVGPDLEVEARLLGLLEGFEGVFQAQFAGDYLLDVNPRVYGSLPLAVKAGANLPAIFCDALAGKVPERTIRARPGVFFRWLEGDLRNVLLGVRSGDLSAREAVGLLRPKAGSAHGPESLRDPKPMLARLAYAAKTNRWREGLSGLGTRS